MKVTPLGGGQWGLLLLLALGIVSRGVAEDSHPVSPPPSGAATPDHPDAPAAHAGEPSSLPDSLENLVQMLPAQLVAQPWEVGRPLVERIVSQAPLGSVPLQNALLTAARYAAAKQQYGEAILYYERWRLSAETDPRKPQVLIELGQQYREVGLIKSAIDCFYLSMRTVRISEKTSDPFARIAKWEVAETSYRAHDWKRARKLFDLFAKDGPSNNFLTQSAYYRMGDCSYAMGDRGQAIVDYQRALTYNNRHLFAPEARVVLLQIFLERDNNTLAHQVLRELAESIARMPPADALYWKRRSGEVLFREMARKHSFKLSFQILDVLAGMDPAPAWQGQVLFWRGLTNIEVSQWDQALANFTNIPPAAIQSSPILASTPGYTNLCSWIVRTNQRIQDLQLPPPEP